MAKRILRRPQVKDRSGLPNSSMHVQMANGLFPKPVFLSTRAVGWPEDEVDAVIAARIAGRPDEEIRHLVARMEAARKNIGRGGE